MVRRISGKTWVWSLIAACLIQGILFLLDHTGLFSRYFLTITELRGIPPVTPSLIIGEFTANLSRIYSHWAWVEEIPLAIALLPYVLVGWWTAQRTGSVKTGFLAGLWAGLFSGLITFFFSAVQFFQLMHSYSSTAHDSFAAQMYAYTFATTLADDLSSFLNGFVLFGLLAGMVGGVCGGILGRRFRVSPC
jgi:hypothetical protein